MSGESKKMNIKGRVLDAINEGRITMRPRWSFILRIMLAASGVVILLLALFYLASFVIFILHQTGAWFIPGFGARGLYIFLISLPWLVIILALVFVVILEVLVRHFAFAYRRPLLYSISGIVAAVFIGGFIVAATPLQPRLFRYAEEGRLPVAGRFYRQMGRAPMRHIHIGTIASTTDGNLWVEGPFGKVLEVELTPETRLPPGVVFAKGDKVLIFGERNGGRVR